MISTHSVSRTGNASCPLFAAKTYA